MLAILPLSCVPNPYLDAVPVECGDGIVHPYLEDCDDGNSLEFDGCTSTCELVFYDDFTDGLDARWMPSGSQPWVPVSSAAGGFVEVSLSQSEIAKLSLDFTLSADGVVEFDERIIGEFDGESIKLTLTVDGEERLSDGSNTETAQHHEYLLSAGPHSFSWSASAELGSGFVRVDNVYIGPPLP